MAGIRTRAVRDGDEWVINGSKMWITSGTQADWLCLLCRTSDEGGYRGMSQIVVPTDRDGFSVSRKLDKLGMRASDTAELVFDDLRIPCDHTIGQVGQGFQQQMAQFQNERMIASYQMVGAVELALERTVGYLKERQAFGAPLLANQTLQYELADIAAELDLIRHHNWAAVSAANDGVDITRHATGGQAEVRPARPPHGRRRGAVPRRHGIRRGELAGPVLPGFPPVVDRRRRRRGHAAHAGSDERHRRRLISHRIADRIAHRTCGRDVRRCSGRVPGTTTSPGSSGNRAERATGVADPHT